MLPISVILLVASFETAVFSPKRAAADGHAYVYMAQQFLANPASFFSYAPPPAPAYFPEVFICGLIQLIDPSLSAWQVIGIANVVLSFIFVWVLAVLFPISISAKSQLDVLPTNGLKKREIYIAPLAQRFSWACMLLAFLNFLNGTQESFFGLDASNAHMGSYVTSLLLVVLIFGTHKPITQVVLITFCALGIFSSKLVIASAAAPLLIVIFIQSLRRRSLGTKAIKSTLLLLALSLCAFIPNLLFTEFEALQRANLSLDNVLPTLAIWIKFGRHQINHFGAEQFVYGVILATFFLQAVRYRSHPIGLMVIASLLACFLASLLAGTFRGWNLRYFGGPFFLGAGLFIGIQSRLTRPALTCMAVLTSLLALQNTYDFSYPETREKQLADCLRPLLAERVIKRGMAGHWDSEPINHFLRGRYLIKTTLRDVTPRPYQWMVDTEQNKFDQRIDFAVENTANAHYQMTNENLKRLSGHTGTIECEAGMATIHLYEATELARSLSH